MKNITLPLYPTIAALAMAFALVIVAVLAALDTKATSEESHVVFNYIQANALPAPWEARFHAINNAWPPSRNALASLLLDAQAAVARRIVK